MREKTRIAVFVSGGGTNLQALLDTPNEDGEIVLVLSNQKSAYALTRARNANIPGVVITKKECGSQELFEERMLEIMEQYRIDLIVLAGFLSILSEKFISRYPKRILNIHPSLIPSFCGKGFYGLKVHEEALAYGVKVTGATVHFVNEIPDGGEILLQKAVEVLPEDTPEVLQKRVMEEAEWKLLPEAVKMISRRIREEE